MKETTKQKLTLSVNSYVVKKARDMGINISEMTEEILRSFTFNPSTKEIDTLYEQYDELFKTMLPFLKKSETSVCIGSFELNKHDERDPPESIYLNSNGTFSLEPSKTEIKNVKDITISDFIDPKNILTIFLITLSRAARNRNKKSNEFEMARKIIEAIDVSNNRTISKTTKKYAKKKRIK